MLKDTDTYEIIKKDSCKKLITSLSGVLVRWKDLNYDASQNK